MNASKTPTRRIANQKDNRFVANAPVHKATKMAPDSFYEPLPPAVVSAVEQRQRLLMSVLEASIGAPLYSRPGFIPYCGDSAELLGELAQAGVRCELTVTSPPYNIGKEYEHLRSVEDYVEWCARWMTRIYDVTSPTGAFWLNLGYLEVPGRGLCVPIPYLLWDKSPFYMLQEVIWRYGAGVNARKRLSPRNEKWLFFAKNASEFTFNLDDIRDPNVKYPNQKKNGKFRCNPLGKNPSDVWDFPKVTTGKNRSSRERTGHPAQCPLGVVERVVLASSNQAELVVDPFAGSCSAGVAAAALGRLFVGIELKPEYCDLAIARYEEFCRQKSESDGQPELF